MDTPGYLFLFPWNLNHPPGTGMYYQIPTVYPAVKTCQERIRWVGIWTPKVTALKWD